MQTETKQLTEKIVEMKFDKTVLIVEKDYISYRILEYMIGITGAKVIWVQNGTEAINACWKNPEINLVFMDINMPSMDGLDATRKIKEIRKELPVIVQTANNDYRDIGFEIGCDDFIIKPFNKDIINHVLNKFIGE